MPIEEDNVFFDVEGLSKYLHASQSTVYKLAQNGELPCKKMGRQWRFCRSEIDRWIANRCGDELAGAVGGTLGIKSAFGVGEASLSEYFTDEQIDLLAAFDIDSPQRLLRMFASSKRRNGLVKLLGMTSDALDEIADKIAKIVK